MTLRYWKTYASSQETRIINSFYMFLFSNGPTLCLVIRYLVNHGLLILGIKSVIHARYLNITIIEQQDILFVVTRDYIDFIAK